MIALIEGAKRQKTPNEIALNILLSALTIIFLLVCVCLRPFGSYIQSYTPTLSQSAFSVTVLIALLVCLIPTTIGGLLSAIGIAGIDRMVQKNVLAMSGKAVEAAGDVHVLLLDKTGTITVGNRQAVGLYPAPGVTVATLAEAAQLASLADETPEGKSIVRSLSGRLRKRACASASEVPTARVRPFHRADAHERRRRRRAGRFARARPTPFATGSAKHFPRRGRGQGRGDRQERWHAAGCRRPGHRARDRSPEGHRQGGPRRAVQALPGHGHPDGDDHR